MLATVTWTSSPGECRSVSASTGGLFGTREGFDKVIFFSTDRLSLVHRLHSSVMDRSSVGLLVDGIKSMTNFFMSVSFIHMKRNLNKAAHILA
jgi:hypothetical protein